MGQNASSSAGKATKAEASNTKSEMNSSALDREVPEVDNPKDSMDLEDLMYLDDLVETGRSGSYDSVSSYLEGNGTVHDTADLLGSGLEQVKIWKDQRDQQGSQDIPPKGDPPLFKLPDEIFLQITKDLSARDLRRLQATSRKLAALLEDRVFNKKLFRGTASKVKVTDWKHWDVALHPVLSHLDFFTETIENVFLTDPYGLHTSVRITDTSFWNKMVSNPPVTKVAFKLHHLPIQTVQRSTGVRICNLILAILTLLNKPDKAGELKPVGFNADGSRKYKVMSNLEVLRARATLSCSTRPPTTTNFGFICVRRNAGGTLKIVARTRK